MILPRDFKAVISATWTASAVRRACAPSCASRSTGASSVPPADDVQSVIPEQIEDILQSQVSGVKTTPAEIKDALCAAGQAVPRPLPPAVIVTRSGSIILLDEAGAIEVQRYLARRSQHTKTWLFLSDRGGGPRWQVGLASGGGRVIRSLATGDRQEAARRLKARRRGFRAAAHSRDYGVLFPQEHQPWLPIALTGFRALLSAAIGPSSSDAQLARCRRTLV